LLYAELQQMGASDVMLDEEHCYVYATIPATVDTVQPVLGFVAHMDTSPAVSGKDVQPQLVKNYDGSDIALGRSGLVLSPAQYPDLLKYVGMDLITSDGTTLLGADDKAGIAEIMQMAQFLLHNPSVPHGTIKIGFTPDEEVGAGVDFFDVAGFGADFAYTLDGGGLGDINFENFNAANARVRINGVSIHPGTAKGKMLNALLVAMEFQQMLPAYDNPATTERYEGFFHLDNMCGGCDSAEMVYIIRDHDRETFERRKKLFCAVGDFLNDKYRPGTVSIELADSYYNMREVIDAHKFLIDNVVAAMRQLDIAPLVEPIRGGTDGARLSFMGLPCPNICTGGHNFHGRYEYIPIQSMERVVELLLKVLEISMN
jgi:tripeptide aminopeptidase